MPFCHPWVSELLFQLSIAGNLMPAVWENGVADGQLGGGRITPANGIERASVGIALQIFCREKRHVYAGTLWHFLRPNPASLLPSVSSPRYRDGLR
jgi:hypothetical protein